jgi:1-deoxy-D-xylulose-5-phosphate reductoisomerase
MREICFSFRMVAGDLHDCPTTAFSGNRPDVSDAPSIRAVPQAEDQARPCQNVAVFGATGSIGTSTIDVLEHLNRVDDENEWRLWAASGHRNVELLMQLASRADAPPERLIVSDPGMAEVKIPGADGIQVQIGPDALVAAAQADEVDIVVAAIVGRAGLESTLAAVQAGKRVALANKETLVVAGPVVSRAMETSGAELLPVDSEHSAIFQCIGSSISPPKKLILTASGGAFSHLDDSADGGGNACIGSRSPDLENGAQNHD